ncbi:hypothetical protein Lederberg_17 [Pelagibacter phage Lederberg EXVC029P]|nr:hypothetical protein Lederberg_17 [Pelagibacter phage Lederberg EXVC029P]
MQGMPVTRQRTFLFYFKINRQLRRLICQTK